MGFPFLITYFILYTMITKFRSLKSDNINIEFQKVQNNILISVEEQVPECDLNYLDVTLSEENLFDLIGQLLRLQSEIKKAK